MVNWSLAAFIIVLSLVWAILWFKFRGSSGRVKVYPLLLIVRLGFRGEPLSGSQARMLSLLGWFSIFLFIALMAFFYYYAINLFIARYITRPEGGGVVEGFAPLIPGVTIPLDENLIVVLTAVGLAILVHELAHALMARAVNVRVKDAGFILLAFIPGAFVEPDEAELRRAPLTSRLKIYSAGVTANVIVGLLALIIFVASAPLLYQGVLITGVEDGSPASKAGLKEGMVVTEVNGLRVRSVDDFIKALEDLGVRDEGRSVELKLKVLSDGRELTVTVVKPEGMSRIGITISQYLSWGPLTAILWALAVINIGLALVNAAPIIIPTPAGAIASDGGHLVGDILERILGEKAKILVTPAIGLATLLLIVSLLTITPLRFTP